eukprot:COSAG06_NODE_15617_length_1058_cov_0.875912_1_plen_352_part_11
MKVLVHHDLRAQIEACPQELPPHATEPPFAGDVALVKELGAQFCDKGVLSKDLLPWLWRNLSFSLLDRPEEVDFLLALLTRLGLLTTLTNQESPVWLLPMRLPVKDINLSAAASMAKAKFAAFFERMGSATAIQGLDSTPISSLRIAVSFIIGNNAPSQAELAHGCDLAESLARSILAAGPDEYGLSEDEIAAINLYTQDVMFRALNRALWSKERGAVKPYWGYIRLLQHALFKVPKCEAGVVYRGIKDPYEPITEASMLAIATESSAAFPAGGSGEVVIWWGFSSCSTNQQPVMEFLNKDGVAVDRVLYTIEGGSSARDVRRYSHYPEEDEVLMPFGSTFVVTTASRPDPN